MRAAPSSGANSVGGVEPADRVSLYVIRAGVVPSRTTTVLVLPDAPLIDLPAIAVRPVIHSKVGTGAVGPFFGSIER